MSGPGTTNFASFPANSAFYVGFVQHEPGPVCTTLMDKPFSQNYDECLRYYQKSYPYATALANTSSYGFVALYNRTATSAEAYGLTFGKPMAKTPTVTIYDNNNGAVNSIMDNTSSHHAVTAVNGSSEKAPFYTLTTSGLTVAGTCYAQFSADTGW